MIQSEATSPRVAIVTGAAKGIGLAIAKTLARDGYVVVMVDIDPALIEIAGQLRLTAHTADISEETDVANLFALVQSQFGRIDVVVNNAGIIRDHMIWRMTTQEFDDVIRVNLRGTWLMCRQAAIHMRPQGFGNIINIASRAWLGNMGQTNYAASKAGIVGLTRSLALELGTSKVRVNAVAPGLIDTPLAQSLPEDVRTKLINAQPTRTMGTPEDVAEVVSFLATDRSAFMTGQVLYVDGGKSIGAGI